MSRYIDADALMAQVVKKKPEAAKARWTEGFNDAIMRVRSMIHSAPTADVVEVRHGHWIEHTAKPGWLEDDVEVFYNCSECGTGHWSIIPPYCPNCGAKMDGERRG